MVVSGFAKATQNLRGIKKHTYRTFDNEGMTYVYILRSVQNPRKIYVGVASDLRARLKSHNLGQSRHTARFRPWELETYLAFSSKLKACAFEKYLKHGSGHAFLKRHL